MICPLCSEGQVLGHCERCALYWSQRENGMSRVEGSAAGPIRLRLRPPLAPLLIVLPLSGAGMVCLALGGLLLSESWLFATAFLIFGLIGLYPTVLSAWFILRIFVPVSLNAQGERLHIRTEIDPQLFRSDATVERRRLLGVLLDSAQQGNQNVWLLHDSGRVLWALAAVQPDRARSIAEKLAGWISARDPASPRAGTDRTCTAPPCRESA
jgi:hypothetical protein